MSANPSDLRKPLLVNINAELKLELKAHTKDKGLLLYRAVENAIRLYLGHERRVLEDNSERVLPKRSVAAENINRILTENREVADQK